MAFMQYVRWESQWMSKFPQVKLTITQIKFYIFYIKFEQ